MWNRFKTFDPWLYVIPFALMVISVVLIYTLSVNSSGSGLYVRQAGFAVFGALLMILATFIDYRALKGWSIWLYVAGLLFLLAVKVFGRQDFGAQRWIDIGFFQFQPGELEKLVIVVTMAALLSKTVNAVSNRQFFLSLLLLLIPVWAVLIQPDLGTAIVIIASGIGIMLHARLSWVQRGVIAAGFLCAALAFGLSFHNVRPFSKLLKDYQKDRLASFVEPSRDRTGSGYNVVQSVIAVGSGGLVGKGLGLGSQSQLNFLPVAHADFIFAGIAEAWGLAGSWGIIGLFAILLIRILQAARIAKDGFGTLLCIGILVKIMVEVLVNIGMNIRLMPVTGIPLPFLSYGGTTMLTNALAIGIAQSVVVRYKRLTF
jgi:rod shape determining protein RodA